MKHSNIYNLINNLRSLLVLRVSLSILVAIHGWARFLSDAVSPFGDFLTAQGFPLGFWIAIGITIFEIIGSVFYLSGRYLFPLSLIFSFIYFMGIILVHFTEGWFVVGLGRNGMEYSVLLIICFLIVGFEALKKGKNNDQNRV